MDIRLLKYFIAVAEEGNISKAAIKLHMSQPPLSKQMKLLEQELGTALFIRGNKNIQLTEAGIFLKHRAEDIIASLDLTQRQLGDFTNGQKGHIMIGTIEAYALHGLPQILTSFHKQYPEITYEISCSGNCADHLDKLKKGILDIAFVREVFDKKQYLYHKLPADHMGVLIPKSHPYANPTYEFITPDMLNHQTVSMPSHYGNAMLMIENWMQQYNVQPNILCYRDSYSLPLGESLAKNNLCLSIILGNYENLQSSECVYKPLKPEITSNIYMIKRKDQYQSEASLKFWNYFTLSDNT